MKRYLAIVAVLALISAPVLAEKVEKKEGKDASATPERVLKGKIVKAGEVGKVTFTLMLDDTKKTKVVLPVKEDSDLAKAIAEVGDEVADVKIKGTKKEVKEVISIKKADAKKVEGAKEEVKKEEVKKEEKKAE